jgi:hypothetical protein
MTAVHSCHPAKNEAIKKLHTVLCDSILTLLLKFAYIFNISVYLKLFQCVELSLEISTVWHSIVQKTLSCLSFSEI